MIIKSEPHRGEIFIPRFRTYGAHVKSRTNIIYKDFALPDGRQALQGLRRKEGCYSSTVIPPLRGDMNKLRSESGSINSIGMMDGVSNTI